MPHTFYSNGKLLLSGEYAILDGATGVAIPTRYGQSLSIHPNTTGALQWTSFTNKNEVWFEGSFALESFKVLSTSDTATAQTLTDLLHEAKRQNPYFLLNSRGMAIQTHLNFPRNWGLGSSSTLINNLAQWTKVNPYQLLWNTTGGSGYDIACAQRNYPITYRLQKRLPKVEAVAFDPPFKNNLYFVHSNKKQQTKAAVAEYVKGKPSDRQWIEDISTLGKKMVTAATLSEFERILYLHESLLSEVLGCPTVKSSLFSDYPGAVKSLGAWGGDFMLVTATQELLSYFTAKGFHTIIPYTDMVCTPE